MNIPEWTILIVEDEPELRHAIARFLQQGNYTVVLAASVEEALVASAGTTPVDLVLCDFYLPRANGLDLAKQLNQSRPGLPFVFMSGSEDACDRLAQSGYVCLHKPFSFHRLEQTFAGILKPPHAESA